MKKLLLSSVAAIAFGGVVYAQSDDAMRDAIDLGIEQLNEGGANFTYDRREIEADNSLVFEGISLAPEDEEILITADWLKISPSTEVGGEVSITISPTVNMTFLPGEDDAFDLTLQNEGLELVVNWITLVAGTPAATLTADSLTVSGDDPDHPLLRDLNFASDDLALSFAFEEASRDAEASLSLSSMDIDYTMVDIAGGVIRTATKTDGLDVDFTAVSLPEDDAEFEDFLKNGGAMKLTLEGGASEYDMQVSGDSANPLSSIAGTGGSGSVLFSIEEGFLTYETEFGEIDYTVTMNPAAMPLPPFEVAMAGGSMAFAAPMIETEDLQDAKIGLNIRELTVSDTVWGMIDPGATLPRDPATLEIDVTAALKLFTTLDKIGDTGSPMEAGQLDNVDVNRIFLTIAGATVEAIGDVAMDNSGPVPIPNGAIDIAASGVQTLTQSLVDLGLVEQVQAGMVMGMMLAFAEAGDEPDTFTSKIEFKNGAVLANGQPIQ